jgi:Family of unknown function (DUF5856)
VHGFFAEEISAIGVVSPMSADDVNFFFTMRSQVKLFHWQTTSYARHKATDDLIKALDENTDKYVEVYMGRYGRPKMTARNSGTRIQNLNEKSIVKFIKACIGYLEVDLVKKLKPSDTDLVNLRDEMLGELNQLMYLFTLH